MTTSGQMTLREKDMAKEWTARGSKPRILGYMSMGDRVPVVTNESLGSHESAPLSCWGERVPEVMTTD